MIGPDKLTTKLAPMPEAALSETPGPRRPVRANGRRRFEVLLDAAERILQRADGEPMSIQRLAREAGVPMASVYHFLPHPAAVSIALSERYLAGLEARICAPFAEGVAMDWPQIIAVLSRRAVDFYRSHPYAQTLILGSDHSWAIRKSDLSNNRRVADAVTGFLSSHFPEVSPEVLLEAVVTGITVGDAVFSLSIGEHGEITDRLAQESWLAVCGYIAARFRRATPAPESYSIFIDHN